MRFVENIFYCFELRTFFPAISYYYHICIIIGGYIYRSSLLSKCMVRSNLIIYTTTEVSGMDEGETWCTNQRSKEDLDRQARWSLGWNEANRCSSASRNFLPFPGRDPCVTAEARVHGVQQWKLPWNIPPILVIKARAVLHVLW